MCFVFYLYYSLLLLLILLFFNVLIILYYSLYSLLFFIILCYSLLFFIILIIGGDNFIDLFIFLDILALILNVCFCTKTRDHMMPCLFVLFEQQQKNSNIFTNFEKCHISHTTPSSILFVCHCLFILNKKEIQNYYYILFIFF